MIISSSLIPHLTKLSLRFNAYPLNIAAIELIPYCLIRLLSEDIGSLMPTENEPNTLEDMEINNLTYIFILSDNSSPVASILSAGSF